MTSMHVHDGLEMTRDRLFTHRVRRLVWVSVFALGVIWVMALMDDAPVWVLALLAAGWLLMPSILAVSLRRPTMRYALIIPATVVPIGLAWMVLTASEATLTGWILMTVGILFGGFLGMWFWVRWFPVPRVFSDPYGVPRVALIGVHIALILAGAAMVAAGL